MEWLIMKAECIISDNIVKSMFSTKNYKKRKISKCWMAKETTKQ